MIDQDIYLIDRERKILRQRDRDSLPPIDNCNPYEDEVDFGGYENIYND